MQVCTRAGAFVTSVAGELRRYEKYFMGRPIRYRCVSILSMFNHGEIHEPIFAHENIFFKTAEPTTARCVIKRTVRKQNCRNDDGSCYGQARAKPARVGVCS